MPEIAAREVDAAEFERLVRDALANLFDPAALATHPLALLLVRGEALRENRADQLRRALLESIEALRPSGEVEPRPGSPEWRPYVLLHQRYVEGANLHQLQAILALSERQLRREHSRAIQAVAAHLRDRLIPGTTLLSPEPANDAAQPPAFPVNTIPLDLLDLLSGVVATLGRRAESEGATLEVVGSGRPRVLSDRVILRQVLFSLLSFVLDIRDDGPVTISSEPEAGRVHVTICFCLEEGSPPAAAEEEKALSQACFWCEKIDVGLPAAIDRSQPGFGRLALSLPGADRPLVLVVDDQESALRMFQRYLGHTELRLTGVRDGAEVLPLARRLQPQAITLDVMMPNVDGWEVLQGLKADPSTRHIPVIVCSVWEEPELANSLGAADFLSKPIRQKDLLAALERLQLIAPGAMLAP